MSSTYPPTRIALIVLAYRSHDVICQLSRSESRLAERDITLRFQTPGLMLTTTPNSTRR